MAIHAEVAAVDGDLGEGAARAGRAGLVPNLVPHELAHEAAILSVVVESQVPQAADVLTFLVVVELHLERWAGGVLRAEESFFADAHILVGDALDADVCLDVGVGGGRRLEFAARWQGVFAGAPLVAQGVPVLLRDGDVDLE